MSFRERSQASRNGLPERRGYVYRGEANPAARRILLRLSPAERLDVCEAVAGPDPEWHAEARQEEADAAAAALRSIHRAALATSREARAAVPVPAVVLAEVIRQEPPTPPPAARRGRCRRCGYTGARCCCPAGPRGGGKP